MSVRLLTLVVLGFCLFAVAAHAQLRGHGGPVRALAVSPDGRTAISGSFDSSAIRWSLVRDSAVQVLRFHDGAVNAVATLKDGRIVTAGEDRRIAIWMVGATSPNIVLEGHDAPVSALAVSPDGTTLASAAWDHTVRLWQLVQGSARVLEGHQQNVNGVAFTPDGNSVISVGYDLTVRIWPVVGGAPTIVTLPAPLNCIAVARDGEIVAGAADGKVYSLVRGATQRRGRSGFDPDHRDCNLARRSASRSSCRSRLNCGHRAHDAQNRTYADRTGTARLVGGISARQPHALDRRG